MPPIDCNDARRKERALDKAVDLFWVMSFVVGIVVGVVGIVLTSTVIGALAAVGIVVVAGVGMAVLYKKLTDGLRKVRDWISQNC